MFRALVVLRIVLLVNAIVLNWVRRDNFDHPGLGLVAIAIMVVWTGFAVWAYGDNRRRVPVLLLADLAIAVSLMLASPLIKGEGLRATIPGFWVAGALIAWAIHWHWKGGLVAGTVICAADLMIRNEVTQSNYGNIFLLMIAGPIVGYLCQSIQQMAVERDRAERTAAVAAERTRLARAVHDGVLQVLALVQRRGPELGPDGPELARLAGEQETALRALIRQQDALVTTPAADSDAASRVDLAAALEHSGERRRLRIQVSTPGTPVLVPEPVSRELVDVVGACLDNVATHVGVDAPVWLLLEELPDAVVVSVRDEGPGIEEGRLAAAEAEGRLGVTESIRGRMRDLGGTAELVTRPGQGTEWELTLPRRP